MEGLEKEEKAEGKFCSEVKQFPEPEEPGRRPALPRAGRKNLSGDGVCGAVVMKGSGGGTLQEGEDDVEEGVPIFFGGLEIMVDGP